MMDREKLERRRSIRLVVSEFIMVVAVILTVAILALLVSGYWINSDFEVERQGMLQIHSMPTGANVLIDGESSWLQRTNTSKVLPSGEHVVLLSREGYDTWSKTINISEGLLYKIHYPRLFLLEREREKVYDATGSTFASFSQDKTKLLLVNETSSWSLINLEDEKISPKKIEVSQYFSSITPIDGASASVFDGEVLSTKWAKDNTNILVKVKNGESIEWVLLNTRNLENSFNLTREFGADFERVEMLNNLASTLLVLRGGSLYKIDMGSRQMSVVLAENVISLDYLDNEVVFAAQRNDGYYLGYIKLSDDNIDVLIDLSAPARVAMSKFYDDKYITVLVDNKVYLYQKQDFELVLEEDLAFSPTDIKVGRSGDFVVMSRANILATLDMEAMKLTEWSVEGDNFGWLDNNMVYSVKDGELVVYDYDGLNRRELAKNVSSHFPVTITNNKWMYYFSDNELVREWLIPR